MGIEQFFSSIEENSITNLLTSFTKKLEKRIETKYLYIDFNSIIYITSFKVLSELNFILYRLITGDKGGEKFKKLTKQYDIDHNNSTTPEQFNQLFPPEKVSELVLEKIDEYLVNVISNYVDPEKLKLLYIAVDGVPSKSKMIEQKSRRYMGGIMGQIKKKIYTKYEALLKTQKNRYIYENLKIGWIRNLINPGTTFMDDLNELLRSDQLVNKIKKACPHLDQYILSGVYEPGEGEQKIVDHLRSLPQEKSSYVIYSPDSDVTLLGLILNTAISGKRVSKLKILRHNQQKGNYDIINIDKLARNIYRYVVDKVGLDSRDNQTLDKDTVIRDIVLMLTIFGNDFLPKLESFTVRQDFTRIIDKYVYVIKKSVEDKHEGINYVTYWSKKEQKHKIDQRILTSLIKVLQFDEGGNLQKKYLVSHYQNYNWLKKMMGADQTNFTTIMTKFLDQLRKFHLEMEEIRNNRDLDNFIDDWTSKNKEEFIKKLMKLTRLEGVKAKNPDEFIEAYVEYVERSGKLPKINIMLRPFDKSLRDDYHRNILEKNVKSLDSTVKVTKYDEEMYKFDNMLDEYVEKLSSQPMDLGKVYIDQKTYVWKAEKIEDSVENYYKDFFTTTTIFLVLKI
jgi:5'-3' exonuclease